MEDLDIDLNVQISLKILRREISFEGEVYQEMKTLKGSHQRIKDENQMEISILYLDSQSRPPLE